jgi:hypothetical protein
VENRFKDYLAGLTRLTINRLPVYHSSGCEKEALIIGEVTSEAYGFLHVLFKEKPEIILLVLDEEDWRKRASRQPYGDPFVPDVRVHYGTKPPDGWKEMFSLLASEAPPDLREKLASIAGLKSSSTVDELINKIFTLEFFAPTVAHEIAHPFLGLNLVLPQPVDFEYAFRLDAFWLGEFLPQYAMYSFLQATNKPLCEKWLLLMKSAYEGGKGRIRYKGLHEMGTRYAEMIKSCIENIYWYQAKLFLMSAELYEQYKQGFLTKASQKLRLTERLLTSRLEQSFENFQEWLKEWK